jgi:demethylmenaquinone methyltransferase/2-methoxy-6-polyprenyl-1,4-benzoquinol methylase
MRRVVKPGGKVICPSSAPQSRLLPALRLYSFSVITAVGEIITGNRSAYEYLPESIRSSLAGVAQDNEDVGSTRSGTITS